MINIELVSLRVARVLIAVFCQVFKQWDISNVAYVGVVVV